MKILFDIGHPAHVHLFKNLAWKLTGNGHRVHFTLREKEHERDLLTAYGFESTSFGRKYHSIAGKIAGMIKFDLLETIAAIRFRPDMLISHGSIYAAHAAAVLRIPHIALEDTGNWEQIRLYLPFTRAVISPDVLGEDLGKKQISYPGYHELAYLHPNYFTPDPQVFQHLGINPGTPYAILRFIGWNATHDIGKKGLSLEMKRQLIRYLDTKMKVFISSELNDVGEFAGYRIKLPPEKMHDALAFASLYIGEGTTMAAEAGILGTPAFYVSNVRGQNCEDLEKYGLVYTFTELEPLTRKIDEVLSDPDLKSTWLTRRNRMLLDKIDLTAMLAWFVEKYPQSHEILRKDPQHLLQFRDMPSARLPIRRD